MTAYENTKRIGDTKNAIKTLDFLYALSDDSDFLKRRTRIKDSIVLAERTLKHDLVKIKYRTRQQEQKNADLLIDNRRNKNQKIVFGITTLLSVLILGLVFSYFKQRQRVTKQLAIIEKLKVRADEKDQLALYLHDDVASDVVVGLQKAKKIQSKTFSKEWDSVLLLFKEAYSKMRNQSQDLSLQHFSAIPFTKKLKALFIKMEFAIETRTEYAGLDDISWEEIPTQIRMNIYSIIREALINIQRHASALEILVVFEEDAKYLTIKIQDNGVGFDTAIEQEGIGLLNLKKRIVEMDGRLVIDSSLSKGTLLIIQLSKLWK